MAQSQQVPIVPGGFYNIKRYSPLQTVVCYDNDYILLFENYHDQKQCQIYLEINGFPVGTLAMFESPKESFAKKLIRNIKQVFC